MSDRLADEVLLAILANIAAQVHDVDEYTIRKQTLANVCLASRRLCRVAQPLLWRQLRVRDVQQLEQIRTSSFLPHIAQAVKVYDVCGEVKREDFSKAADVATSLPGITELTLVRPVTYNRYNNLDVRDLSRYSNLRCLALDWLWLASTPPPALPHLEDLWLTGCCISPESTREWIQPANLPRLRVLRFSECRDHAAGNLLQLTDALSPSILPQLDYVHTREDALDPRHPWAQSSSPPFLLTQMGRHTEIALHFHLALSGCRSMDAALCRVRTVVNRVRALPPAPPGETRVLVASRVLQLAAEPTATRADPSLRVAARKLQYACRSKGVRIVWEADRDAIAPLVKERLATTPAFWHYARELKKGRQWML